MATDKIEEDLERSGKKLDKNPAMPFSSGYQVELDISRELNPKDINKFQELVGILRWIVELGQVDVLFEVTALLRFLASPREGHLEQAYRIFGYLRAKINGRMIMDPTYVDIDYSRFTKGDWETFYPDAIEEKDMNDPEPLGKEVRMTCFVDADHAGDKVTRRSYTGLVILLNNAPIYWLCK